jgi:hypothetical protein
VVHRIVYCLAVAGLVLRESRKAEMRKKTPPPEQQKASMGA